MECVRTGCGGIKRNVDPAEEGCREQGTGMSGQLSSH